MTSTTEPATAKVEEAGGCQRRGGGGVVDVDVQVGVEGQAVHQTQQNEQQKGWQQPTNEGCKFAFSDSTAEVQPMSSLGRLPLPISVTLWKKIIESVESRSGWLFFS